MSFIGIITNLKNMEYMSRKANYYFNSKEIIFITDKNIHNMRNVKFDIIIIDDKIKNVVDLKEITSNAKYVILNADLNIELKALENLKLIVITYGFKNKATFAVSSVSENSVIICLQRMIININNQSIEPQEFEVELKCDTSVHAIIAVEILGLLYKKSKT